MGVVDWGIVAGIGGLLLTIGNGVYVLGRRHGAGQRADADHDRSDSSLDQRLRKLENQQLLAKVEANREDIRRLWDYVRPTAQEHLRHGGAVRFTRGPDRIPPKGEDDGEA